MILKISQLIHTVFITCQHMVTFSYTYFHAWKMMNTKKENLDKKKEASNMDLAHAALQLHTRSYA